MRRFTLAGARIELLDSDLTLSTYAEGQVAAIPQDDSAYLARAQSLGYGDNTALMSREHEVAHHLLAHWLGLPHSPTMMGLAIRKPFKDWRVEEAAILGIQAFARLMGVSLLAVAEKAAK